MPAGVPLSVVVLLLLTIARPLAAQSPEDPAPGVSLAESSEPSAEPAESGTPEGDETANDAPDSDEPEWIRLFDGQSIESWIRRGGRADFEVVDGTIVGTSRPGSANSFLCTPDDYADFELEFECRVDAGLNSGVQIRSHSRQDYRGGRVYGLQVEIDPSDRSWTGGIYDEGRSGWLFTLENRPEARAAFRPEQWNQLRVEARGERIRTWVNSIPAADFRQALDESGFIALQVHSTSSADSLRVRWRNLRIRPLP